MTPRCSRKIQGLDFDFHKVSPPGGPNPEIPERSKLTDSKSRNGIQAIKSKIETEGGGIETPTVTSLPNSLQLNSPTFVTPSHSLVSSGLRCPTTSLKIFFKLTSGRDSL